MFRHGEASYRSTGLLKNQEKFTPQREGRQNAAIKGLASRTGPKNLQMLIAGLNFANVSRHMSRNARKVEPW